MAVKPLALWEQPLDQFALCLSTEDGAWRRENALGLKSCPRPQLLCMPETQILGFFLPLQKLSPSPPSNLCYVHHVWVGRQYPVLAEAHCGMSVALALESLLLGEGQHVPSCPRSTDLSGSLLAEAAVLPCVPVPGGATALSTFQYLTAKLMRIPFKGNCPSLNHTEELVLLCSPCTSRLGTVVF